MKGCLTASRMFLSARVCAVSLALQAILAWGAGGERGGLPGGFGGAGAALPSSGPSWRRSSPCWCPALCAPGTPGRTGGEGWGSSQGVPDPPFPSRAPPAPPCPHLAVATLAQDPEQLEAVGADVLGAVVDAALGNLDLFVVSHRPGGRGGERGQPVPCVSPTQAVPHLLQAVPPGLQLHLLREGTRGHRWAAGE